MSNSLTPGAPPAPGSGFQPGLYPQAIGTFSSPGGAPTSTLATAHSLTAATAGRSMAFSSNSASQSGHTSAPLTTTPAGTAPRKQLAAAAAAGAAAGANNKTGRGGKPSHKKGAGAGGGGGGNANSGKRGGRGGGGGQGGGRSGNTSTGGDAGDGEDGVGGGGKDSDDDNEDEPEVSIEEQFILRLPPGEMCNRFREKVVTREVDESVKLRFTDARRGTFIFEDIDFPTKLVDLPTIIEAQKTLNGKQVYKIADISQMLIVDPNPVEKPVFTVEVKSEPSAAGVPGSNTNGSMPAPSTFPPLKPSDYIWPDGLTNPLKNVRKRRYRKRVSKVAVEGVENEVERLLKEDAAAEEVTFQIREQIDGTDRFDSDDGATPAPEGAHSDMDMDGEMMMELDEDEEDDEEDDDDDLLAELERKIGGGENSTDDDGEGDEDGSNKPATVQSGAGKAGSNLSSNGSITAGRTNIHGAGPTGIRAGASGTGGSSVSFAAGPASSAKASEKSKAKSANQGGDDDDDEDGEDDDDDEEEDEEDDDDDDSGSEDDDEDEDEDDKENAQMEKLLKDEIRELNGKVKDTEEKLQSAPNDILKRRFGSILDNLRKELELKTMQLEEAKERSKSKGK